VDVALVGPDAGRGLADDLGAFEAEADLGGRNVHGLAVVGDQDDELGGGGRPGRRALVVGAAAEPEEPSPDPAQAARSSAASQARARPTVLRRWGLGSMASTCYLICWVKPDSYGYRPGRSALDAVAVCRERCWRNDWVIDLDIRAFFDSVDHSLMLKAVARHTDQRWILLYVKRWLQAPLRQPDGTLVVRDRGTPQGSAISPVLANLYLHYAFDTWLARQFPAVTFERYCDDAVIHCGSEEQARRVRDALGQRLAQVGLELHPDKTRIVYCKDADRRDDHEVTSFTFLGYTFRPRLAKNRWGKHFVNFLPAVSKGAIKAMGRELRSWHIARRSDKSLTDLALMFNSIVQAGSTTTGASTSPCCIPSYGASTIIWCAGPCASTNGYVDARSGRASCWRRPPGDPHSCSPTGASA
jgi:group II intron reverse transcriptase/maturase